MHQRSVKFEGFKRADGLWDIEARLVDTKDHDFPLSSGVIRPGQAVHDMSVRITIDSKKTILEAAISADSTPYPGYCDTSPPDYSKIVGLNLFKGFLKAVKDMFGMTRGCAHMSELLMFLPTVALQTLASEAVDDHDSEHKPFQLDRCHALVSHSETVQRYYPRWHRNQNPGQGILPKDRHLISSKEDA